MTTTTTTTSTTTTTLVPVLPIIALTANTSSVVEGQTIKVTLTTTNIKPGTVFPYFISGLSTADIVGASGLTGNLVVNEYTIPRKTNIGYGFNDWRAQPESYLFQRDNFVIIADEIYWNQLTPTGSALKSRVNQFRAIDSNYKLGLVVTPYTFFPVNNAAPKATENTVLTDIVNSGVDFVALDPYFYNDPLLLLTIDQLYNWTTSFRNKLLKLNKKVFLVIQGFAAAGTEREVKEYNQRLLSLSGIEEFIIFGREDGQDIIDAGSAFVSLNNDFPVTSITTSLDFVISRDFIEEYGESFIFSLFGPGRTESIVVYVDDKIFIPDNFDQSFIRFFKT